MQNFNLKDLKDGMIVKLRNNRWYLVIKNALIHNDGFLDLENYYEDLKNNCLCDFDVIEVYQEPENKASFLLPFIKDSKVISEKLKNMKLLYREVDWNKVPVDTKILVKECEDSDEWFKRHFAKYENGKIYAFVDGTTSFSADEEFAFKKYTPWKYAKIYVGDDE